jgi:hypothetical protein
MPPASEARIVMFSTTKAASLPLWALIGLQLVLAPAQAQTQAASPAESAAKAARADAADPSAQVQPVVHVSPLRAYQAFNEPAVAPWRETNERVRQRGGWRADAREAPAPAAAQPAAPGASRPTPATKPASGGHPGHAGHEMK